MALSGDAMAEAVAHSNANAMARRAGADRKTIIAKEMGAGKVLLPIVGAYLVLEFLSTRNASKINFAML